MAGHGNPATQFTSTRQPATRGRKKGVPAKSTVAKRADEKLDKMLGQAHKNISKALKRGNLRTSMWFVDHVRKERGTRIEPGLLEPLVSALQSLDDVQEASQQAILLAIQGDMSFEQLKATQEALARHTVLSGVIELKKLRDEVEHLMATTGTASPLGTGHIPSWGRLEKLVKSKDIDDAEEVKS